MGNRLSKIYTRTGDEGSTGLGDGTRVAKDHPRVEAYGTVDELNSVIGLLLAQPSLPQDLSPCLEEIQHHLFDIGGELCIPGHVVVKPQQVEFLEQTLDQLNADLPALKEFILPGGGQAAAVCHMARTVCRRVERRVCTLASHETVNEHSICYLNRLSDLFFVMARVIARKETGSEVLWRHDRTKSS